MFWGFIPIEAVLHHFSLSHLELLAQESPNCAQLLGLEKFQPKRSVPQVAAELRDRNIPLRADAIGRIAQTFGLNGANVHLNHIKDFVTSVVDGWSMQCDQLDDVHTMSTHATTFATALQSKSREHNLQDVMGAFIDGCRQGTENIKFYARRRRSIYRRRRTD
jgi:hypothetical protein